MRRTIDVVIPAPHGRLARAAEVRRFTGASEADAALIPQISMASQRVMAWLDFPQDLLATHPLALQTVRETQEILCPVDVIMLGRLPIQEIAAVTVGGVEVNLDVLRLDRSSGLVWRSDRVRFCGDVQITYRCGYPNTDVTSSTATPEALAAALLDAAADADAATTTGGVGDAAAEGLEALAASMTGGSTDQWGVPYDIEMAVAIVCQHQLSENPNGSLDLSVKSESLSGVGSWTYRDEHAVLDSMGFPVAAKALLRRYKMLAGC